MRKPTVRKTAPRTAAKAAARARPARGKLAPRAQKRGLSAEQIVLDRQAPEVGALSEQVTAAGGAVVGAYREPLSGRPVLLAALPLEAVQPTPFQRDLSPTHTQRLAAKIEESGSFLDPLIVVRGDDGKLWTPNGRHRLAAAKMLGLKQIMALVSPDESLAFRILALNTEKAHNLKDRALEVIRMARTLAVVYERNPRFGGGAYSSFLKKVDRFDARTLPASLRARDDCGARIEQIDAQVGRIVEALHARGFKSPYLRNYVVARINPVRFVRTRKGQTEAAMPIAQALTRMAAAAAKFDLASVSAGDVALVAAVATEPG